MTGIYNICRCPVFRCEFGERNLTGQSFGNVLAVLGNFLASLNKFIAEEYLLHHHVSEYYVYDFMKVGTHVTYAKWL